MNRTHVPIGQLAYMNTLDKIELNSETRQNDTCVRHFLLFDLLLDFFLDLTWEERRGDIWILQWEEYSIEHYVHLNQHSHARYLLSLPPCPYLVFRIEEYFWRLNLSATPRGRFVPICYYWYQLVSTAETTLMTLPERSNRNCKRFLENHNKVSFPGHHQPVSFPGHHHPVSFPGHHPGHHEVPFSQYSTEQQKDTTLFSEMWPACSPSPSCWLPWDLGKGRVQAVDVVALVARVTEGHHVSITWLLANGASAGRTCTLET